MKIIEKHLRLSADVCELLLQKKIMSRRSESSIVDEILSDYLSHGLSSNVQKIVKKADTIIKQQGE